MIAGIVLALPTAAFMLFESVRRLGRAEEAG